MIRRRRRKMKPKETDEICDKCKDRLAKYVCLGCECALCSGCTDLLRLQMFTMDFEKLDENNPPGPTQSIQYASFFNPTKTQKTAVGTADWAICKDCRKGLNKKNAINEIQNSDEMKAFINKIRKTTLASKILTGLDESEVNDTVQINPVNIPKNLFNAYQGKKHFLGKLLGKP